MSQPVLTPRQTACQSCLAEAAAAVGRQATLQMRDGIGGDEGGGGDGRAIDAADVELGAGDVERAAS
jgi:hypothetical protein